MARAPAAAHDVADLALAPDGEARIGWAAGQMPVLAQIWERFAAERPLEGIRVAACLHVTAETANLMRDAAGRRGSVGLCCRQPALHPGRRRRRAGAADGIEVRAIRGEDIDTYVAHVLALLTAPAGDGLITIDDGADLQVTAHARGGELLAGVTAGPRRRPPGWCACAASRTRASSPVPCWPSTRPAPSGRSTTATGPANRPWTASCAPPACCWPANGGRGRLRMGRDGRGRAGPRRRRGGDRLRGRPAAGARGADGRL